jgi:hypothetical protein
MQLLRSFIYLVLLILAHFFNQFSAVAQRVNQPVDPSFYEGYKWRNLGPNRGGARVGPMNIILEQQVGDYGKRSMGVMIGFLLPMVRSSHQVLGQLLWRKQTLTLFILEVVKRS